MTSKYPNFWWSSAPNQTLTGKEGLEMTSKKIVRKSNHSKMLNNEKLRSFELECASVDFWTKCFELTYKLDLSSHSKASWCTCEPVMMKSCSCSEEVVEELETTYWTERGNNHTIALMNQSSRINDQLYFRIERFRTLIEAWRLMLLIQICSLQMKSKKRKTHTLRAWLEVSDT